MKTFYETLVESTEQERQYLYSSSVLADCLIGNISIEQYISFLKESYHHVKHTVPLFMICGGRLADEYEWLRKAVAEYIEDEFGHQEWILDDLAVCGVDKEAMRNSKSDMNTEIMVSYAYDTVNRKNPVGLLGMVFVLEGTSTSLATQAEETIKHKLKLPDSAFSYLSSHGSLDTKHIEYYKNLVNKFSSEADKQAIIHCAKVTYSLYANIFRALLVLNQKKVA